MTTKFLKLGLIGAVSVAAISALTVSCGKKETVNNNNQEGGGSTTNPEIEKQLLAAKEKFSITTKEGVGHSTVRANEITKENIEQYFTLSGKLTGFTYTLSKLETIGEHQLRITYKIELSGQSVVYTAEFDGFKGLNLIDYDYNNADDFFAIALNKEHLNTIAFATQQYNEDAEIIIKPGWTLNFEKKEYELTKTDKYIMIKGKKFNVHKIKFVGENPVKSTLYESPVEAPFTSQGKEWHDKNGGFQIAIEDGVNEIV